MAGSRSWSAAAASFGSFGRIRWGKQNCSTAVSLRTSHHYHHHHARVCTPTAHHAVLAATDGQQHIPPCSKKDAHRTASDFCHLCRWLNRLFAAFTLAFPPLCVYHILAWHAFHHTHTHTQRYIAMALAMRESGGNGSPLLVWVGFPLSLLSFVPKVLDVTGQWIWGTAVFHVLVAVGFGILWSWAQTLPVVVV